MLDAAQRVAARAVQAIEGATAPLGLMQASSTTFCDRTRRRRLRLRGLDAPSIDAKVRARVDARQARDFARADALRTELAGLGVEVLDGAEGESSWRVTI